MKVKEIMMQNSEFCGLKDNLKKAAEIMKRRNCDLVPVVDDKNAILGAVSSKNICQALADIERKASLIKIADIKFDKAINCFEDEKIERVIKKMRKNLVKRLIVTSQDSQPIGIISVPDILSLSAR